jgi:NADP-dependent 3-hydroxy acid dehydrogenase YdfG
MAPHHQPHDVLNTVKDIERWPTDEEGPPFDHGVTATAISPGYVDTDMTAWIRDQIPPAEMITADDIAELTLAVCRLSRHAAIPNIVVTRPGPQLWRA